MVCLSPVMLAACHVHRLMRSFHVVLSSGLVVRVDYMGDRGVLDHLMRHMLMLDMTRLRCLVVHWHFVVLNLLIHVVRHSVVDRFVSFEYHLWLMVNWVSHLMMNYDGSVVVGGNRVHRLVVGSHWVRNDVASLAVVHGLVNNATVSLSLVHGLMNNGMMSHSLVHGLVVDGRDSMVGNFAVDDWLVMRNFTVHRLMMRSNVSCFMVDRHGCMGDMSCFVMNRDLYLSRLVVHWCDNGRVSCNVHWLSNLVMILSL